MGNAPMCDCYEARLVELLDASLRGESNDDLVAVSHITTLPNAENSLAATFS
jgi:hypothetical protein